MKMVLVAILVSVCGCNRCIIEYPIFDPNCGKIGYVRYIREGNQEITQFSGIRDANGFSVRFDKQKSEMEVVLEAYNMGLKVGGGAK